MLSTSIRNSTPNSMDEIVEQVCSGDSRQRPELAEKLIMQLQTPGSLEPHHVSRLVEALVAWLKQSNFKICLSGVSALQTLAEREGADFSPHLSAFLPTVIERLGDTKEQVRDACLDLLQVLMDSVSTPQSIFDNMEPAFTHKNWRVKQGAVMCFEQTLNKFGREKLAVSKFMTNLIKLLADPNENVREAASSALVEVYRNIGERVRYDISSNKAAPASKLPSLFERFDAVLNSGTMLATADTESESAPSSRPGSTKPPSRGSISRQGSSVGLSGSIPKPVAVAKVPTAKGSAKAAAKPSDGGLTEEEYDAAMFNVDPITPMSARHLETEIAKIKETLSNINEDWEKRVDSLKTLRGLALGGVCESPNIKDILKSLTDCLILSIVDLRSGVSKEACVTIGTLADAMRNNFAPFMIEFIPSLFKQALINVKVMADSANLCVRQLIKTTYSAKLLNKLWEYRDSKSVSQRKVMIDSVVLLLQVWDPKYLEKHLDLLTQIITAMQNDADSVNRAQARVAFWLFHGHFPADAERIMEGLDAQKKKLLLQERNGLSGVSAPAIPKAISRSKPPTPTFFETVEKPKSADMSLSGVPTTPRAKVPGSANTSVLAGPASAAARIPRPSSASGIGRSGPQRITTTAGAAAAPSLDMSSAPSRVRSATMTKADAASRPAPVGPRRVASTNVIPTTSSIPRTPSNVGARSRTEAATPRQSMSGPAGESPSTPSLLPRRVPSAMSKIPRTPGLNSSLTAPSTPSHGAGFGSQVNEVIEAYGSQDWAERDQAVSTLKSLLRSSRTPTESDVRKLCTLFVNMFAEPHAKVIGSCIDCLCDYIVIYKADIPESWLFDLTCGLLLKLGGNLKPTINAKILYALELIRDSFEPLDQTSVVFRLILDKKQEQNIKVKTAVLEFLALLLPRMNASHLEGAFNASPSEARAAYRLMIHHSNEPKSAELRKMATHVITEVFEMHPPLFSRILAGLPTVDADAARRLLSIHVENWEQMVEDGIPEQPRHASAGLSGLPSPHLLALPSGDEGEMIDAQTMDPEDDYGDHQVALEDNLAEELEGIHLKAKTSTDRPVLKAVEPDMHEHVGGTAAAAQASSRAPHAAGAATPTTATASSKGYNPSVYQDSAASENVSSTANLPKRHLSFEERLEERRKEWSAKSAMASRAPAEPSAKPTLQRVASSSSVNFERAVDSLKKNPTDDRTTSDTESTLQWLLKTSKEGTAESWDRQFAHVLQAVLNLMSDPEPPIRELSIRVLREMLKNQTRHFANDVEAVVLKLLTAHKDTEREVLRAADETLSVLAAHIDPIKCVNILQPIMAQDDNGEEQAILLAAIKLFTKIVKQLSPQFVEDMLPSFLPGLFKGYKHPAAEVRKAVVFGLVEIHLVIGEKLDPHLTALTSSQTKLLKIYIQRAQEKS